MTCDLSERFHDNERSAIYLDLLQSGLDRPAGTEQAYFLDCLASTAPVPRRRRSKPRLSLRWFALPKLPLPFLTWA